MNPAPSTYPYSILHTAMACVICVIVVLIKYYSVVIVPKTLQKTSPHGGRDLSVSLLEWQMVRLVHMLALFCLGRLSWGACQVVYLPLCRSRGPYGLHVKVGDG